MQANAGANVLMIFDSWSHMIPNNFYKQFAVDPTAEIIKLLRLRKINVPIIGFPFKSGASLIEYSYESNVDCIALDWTVNLHWALKNINPSVVIQGNLDPASLIPNYSPFLNVGHGLTPDCKIKNIKQIINIVKDFKS